MVILIVIAALSATAIASTITVIRRDGYRRVPVRAPNQPAGRTKTKEIRARAAT